MEKIKIKTLFTATLILTIALATITSITFGQQINYNPDMGTVTKAAPSYMTEENSVYNAATKYGNLLNEDYAWFNPQGVLLLGMRVFEGFSLIHILLKLWQSSPFCQSWERIVSKVIFKTSENPCLINVQNKITESDN